MADTEFCPLPRAIYDSVFTHIEGGILFSPSFSLDHSTHCMIFCLQYDDFVFTVKLSSQDPVPSLLLRPAERTLHPFRKIMFILNNKFEMRILA